MKPLIYTEYQTKIVSFDGLSESYIICPFHTFHLSYCYALSNALHLHHVSYGI